MAIIGAYLSYKLIPSLKVKSKFEFDYFGFVCFSISMFSVLLAISKGHIWGWTSSKEIILLISFLVFGTLFVLTEQKTLCPIIDFKMFKNKAFALGNIALSVSYMALFTNGMLFPFYAQEILKYSPLVTGLLIFPFSFALIISAPLSGNIAGKLGSRNLTVFGSLIMVIGLFWFSRFNENAAIWQIILAQVIIGVGNGMFQPSSNTAIMNSAAKKDIGMASGILALFRNTGMIIAVAIAVTIFDSARSSLLELGFIYKTAFLNAYHITLYVGIALAFICAAISFFAHNEDKI